MTLHSHTTVAVVSAVLLSCAAPSSNQEPEFPGEASALRVLANEEALADFDQIVSSFRALYAPLQRKEARFGFSFESLAQEYRTRVAAAASEQEYRLLFNEFVMRFEDAHVSLANAPYAGGLRAARLPFTVVAVEGKFVIGQLAPNAPAGLARGDELLSLDGKPIGELVDDFKVQVGFSNPNSELLAAAAAVTMRGAALAFGIGEGTPATLAVRDAQGVEQSYDTSWEQEPDPVAALNEKLAHAEVKLGQIVSASAAAPALRAEISQLGLSTPFYLTPEVKQALGGAERVQPSLLALALYGLTPELAAELDVFATKYLHAGKTFLLLRVHTHAWEGDQADQFLDYVRALLGEQQPWVDGLILDQTHNPGGLEYVTKGLVAMFAKQPVRSTASRLRTDRGALKEYGTRAASASEYDDPEAQEYARQCLAAVNAIDAASDRGQALTDPLPLTGPTIKPDARVVWQKPVLVLSDELSMSGGDMFALLMKENQLAPLFGATTAGAGGNVEQVAMLPNTGAELRMTRSLFTVYDESASYPDDKYVEDNGVEPTIPYAHTLADFRAGYVGYVKAFSDALLEEI